MRPTVPTLTLLATVLGMPAALAHPPLQLFVDLTPEHGVLRLPAGTYGGPVVITRPITLDGQGEVTVDGGGAGTVLTVRAGGATVRGLRITGSGSSYDGVDAGLLVESYGGDVVSCEISAKQRRGIDELLEMILDGECVDDGGEDAHVVGRRTDQGSGPGPPRASGRKG